jgi:type IV pilus biogenesis protein CpaD/CtpE
VWDRYRRFPAGRDGSIWRPTGAAEAAFDAQVAHPGDLIAGHGTSTSDGLTAGVAVERARLGRMPSLPASTISNIGSNGAATAAPQVGGN